MKFSVMATPEPNERKTIQEDYCYSFNPRSQGQLRTPAVPIGLIPAFATGITNLTAQLQLGAPVYERAGEGLPEKGIAAIKGI